jgi:hypothetical protein
MRPINLSIVLLSHLNDMMIENRMGRTDLVSHRIQFIKELLFQYRNQPIDGVEVEESELNGLWKKLYRGVEE